MSKYEELVELGFEGIDRFADKYHDKVYNHLPAWKQRQKQQEKEQHDPLALTNEQQQRRRDSAIAERTRDENTTDRAMSSYSPPHSPSYGPDRRQEYRSERDERYVQDEGWYYKGLNPGAGAVVPRRQDDRRDYQIAPRAPPPAYGDDYQMRREYGDRDRSRPTPTRMRSSSWSPPRNERHRDDSRRRRRGSRNREEKDTDCINPQRLAATIVGGLVGGFAGNRAGKGQKYDTVATIGGAILGGIASREIADHMVNKKDERRNKEEAWESKYGDDERDDGRNDRKRIGDGRESRDSREYSRDGRDGRGWCDRCRCERSRCWCK